MPKNQWPGAAVGADFMSIRSPERANVVRGALQQKEKKPPHANKKDKRNKKNCQTNDSKRCRFNKNA